MSLVSPDGEKVDPGAQKRFMDTHTLELLEFDKIRDLVAAYAACSLGKEAARADGAEPRHRARSATARP